MRRTSLVALAVTAVCLIASSSAFAWGGAVIKPPSCPEIHVLLPKENGPWAVVAKLDNGPVIVNQQVPGQPYEQVVGGLWMPTNATYTGTVTVGNAANINDGKKVVPFQLTNCAMPVGPNGPAGPAGPAGPPGLNGKDSNSANSTTTIIIHEAPKVCTSNRKYAFKVRRYYPGAGGATSQKVVGVTASEPGISDVKVTKTKAGRFVVTWSTTGKKFVAGGTVKTMNIRASLVARVVSGHTKTGKPIYKTAVNPQGPKHIRLVWKYRPCTAKDGNLNDPSAAGQGATGGA